jgi:hypothetical protein
MKPAQRTAFKNISVEILSMLNVVCATNHVHYLNCTTTQHRATGHPEATLSHENACRDRSSRRRPHVRRDWM